MNPKHTHIHKYIHTYTHTYIHKYIHTYREDEWDREIKVMRHHTETVKNQINNPNFRPWENTSDFGIFKKVYVRIHAHIQCVCMCVYIYTHIH